MKGYDPPALVRDVIEAHGGRDLWNSLEALEADISAWGLLFTMKRQPAMNRVRVRALTRKPRFTFLDFPRPGQTGEFIGGGRRIIGVAAGDVVTDGIVAARLPAINAIADKIGFAVGVPGKREIGRICGSGRN